MSRETSRQLKEDLLIERYKALRLHELELNRTTAAFEHASLKPTYLLNGGAIGVFLTLVAALLGDCTSCSKQEVLRWSIWAVGTWSSGLVLAAIATYLAYRSQKSFTKTVKDVRMLEELRQDFDEVYDPEGRKDVKAIQDDRECNRSSGRRNQHISIVFGAFSLGSFIIGAIFSTLALV